MCCNSGGDVDVSYALSFQESPLQLWDDLETMVLKELRRLAKITCPLGEGAGTVWIFGQAVSGSPWDVTGRRKKSA
jgi:hypothetical protein